MKKQALLFLFLIFSVVLVKAQTQEDNEVGARGTFLSTRPIIEETTLKDKTGVAKPNPKRTTKSHNNTKVTLGLGYTLYLKGTNEEAIRVNPTQEFHSGDAVRLVVEPNIEGYLYVFHTENDGQPTMIFPDARLKRGDNKVQAHVPYEVPASDDPEPSLRWFVFDQKSATEHLFLVLSRNPLKNVPTSEELVSYCEKNQGACPLKPSENVWREIKTKSNVTARVSKVSSDQGQTQSSEEKQSIKEAIALGKTTSAPTVIYMHRSGEIDQLVTPITLIHK